MICSAVLVSAIQPCESAIICTYRFPLEPPSRCAPARPTPRSSQSAAEPWVTRQPPTPSCPFLLWSCHTVTAALSVRFTLSSPAVSLKSFLCVCIPLVVLQTGSAVPFAGFRMYVFGYDICFLPADFALDGWLLARPPPTFYSGGRRRGVAKGSFDSFLQLLAFFSHDLIFSKVTLPKCTK